MIFRIQNNDNAIEAKMECILQYMKEEIIGCNNYFKKYESIPSILKFGKRNMGKVDISICIPTFRRPDLLEECINSCLNQKANNLSTEIIIVDNNPEPNNDNLKLIQRLGRLEICYYQNEENIGIFGNWNRCIELAKGKWVSLLHDDDLLAPDCFYSWEKLIIFSKVPDRLAYIKVPAVDFVDLQDIIKNSGIKDRIRKRYGIRFYMVNKFDLIAEGVPGKYGMPTAGTLMKRDAVLEIGGYNTEHFFPSEDVFLPVRLFNNGYKIISTIAPLGYYRCAVNESTKKEIHIGWAQDHVAYRCQAKMLGKIWEKYIHFFGDTQLYYACQYILKRYVYPCDYDGYFDDVPEVDKIKIKRGRFFLYKFIRKIHNYTFYIRALF